MNKLPDPIDQVLDDPIDERFAHSIWARIERPKPRRAPLIRAMVLSAAIAWLLAFFYFRTPAPTPMVLPAPGRAMTFADGTRIKLSERADLEILSQDAERASFLLAEGRVTLDVVPSERRWVVEAGLAQIEVLGTRFYVDRTKDQVEVHVYRGVVLVKSPLLEEGWVKLIKGKSVIVKRAKPVVAPKSPPPKVLEEAPLSIRAPVESTPQPPIRKPRAAERAVARAVEKAVERAVETAPKVAEQPTAEQWMARADQHRAQGEPQRAIEALEQLIDAYPDAPQAPLAAFTLGRLWASSDPERSAAALERALVLGLPSALEEAALARLLRTASEKARRSAAERYLQRFPKGAAREKAQRILGRKE